MQTTIAPHRPGQAAGTLAAILFVWGAALAVTLAVAAETKIGPVVLRLTATHGVHLGDLLTAAAMGVVAVITTVAILAERATHR